MSVPNSPIVNAGLKYVNGLTISFESVTKLIVSPGAARDSLNINDIVLDQAVDGSGNPIVIGGVPVGAEINTAVVGANGLDAPLVINRFYAVYLIGSSTSVSTGVNALGGGPSPNPLGPIPSPAPVNPFPVAGLLSLHFDKPVLPVGYDMFRRIGWTAIDAFSNLEIWREYGEGETRAWYYDVAKTMAIGAPLTTFQTVDVDMPDIVTQAYLDVAFNPSAGAAADFVSFRPTGSTSPNGIVRFGTGALAPQVGDVVVPVEVVAGNAVIDYKVSNAADTLVLNTVGFVDVLS